MIIFTYVCLAITIVGLTIAAAYLAKANRYNRSTEAYLDGDLERGKMLEDRADKFLRWLP